MSANAKKPPSPFALALAARRGDVPPESLSGAAKLLYRDKSLSRDDLHNYVKPGEKAKKQYERVGVSFKRG
jgi:hypothetical protein